jgi:hypothetical protein
VRPDGTHSRRECLHLPDQYAGGGSGSMLDGAEVRAMAAPLEQVLGVPPTASMWSAH